MMESVRQEVNISAWISVSVLSPVCNVFRATVAYGINQDLKEGME